MVFNMEPLNLLPYKSKRASFGRDPSHDRITSIKLLNPKLISFSWLKLDNLFGKLPLKLLFLAVKLTKRSSFQNMEGPCQPDLSKKDLRPQF